MKQALMLLAYRFIRNTHQKSIAMMTMIAFVSIVLASSALSLVAAIMSGFEQETRAIVQGIHPDLTIQGGGLPLRLDAIKEAVLNAYPAEIAGISPMSQNHVLVKASDQEGVGVLGVMLGIDPEAEATVSRLPLLVEKSTKTLSFKDLFQGEQVVIGKALADSLGASISSEITVLFVPESEVNSKTQIFLEQKKVKVGGVFKTGIEDIDAHVLFGSLDLFKNLFPESSITAINLKLNSLSKEDTLKTELKKFLGLSVLSWQDLYPALLSALTLEKYASMLVLALIGLVACVNIMALLFMYITNKKTEIALLRTFGVRENELMGLFVGMGGGIGFAGSILGVMIASLISFLLNEYQLIKLPSVYYITHVPAHMTFLIGICVIILVTVASCIAAYIPARTLQGIDVANLLKQTY